jgi:hypothetical protein
MHIYANITYAADEAIGETTAESLAATILTAVGGDPETDTCSVSITSSSNTAPLPTTPPT